MPPTPRVLSAVSFPFLAHIPGPRGTQRPQVKCQGLWEATGRQLLELAWEVARPPLGLGFPPLSLWAELAGPHRLFGSLRLINRPGMRGELRGGMPSACCVGQLLPAPSTGHHATSLRESEPARGRIGKWGTWPDRPAPLPGLPFLYTPDYKAFSLLSPLNTYLSRILTVTERCHGLPSLLAAKGQCLSRRAAGGRPVRSPHTGTG